MRMVVRLLRSQRGRRLELISKKFGPTWRLRKLSERYFAPSEQATIMQSTQEQRATRFFRYWVAKEAVLKAQGIGLRALSQCEIFMAADGVHAEVVVSAGSPIEPNWGVRLLSCDEGGKRQWQLGG